MASDLDSVCRIARVAKFQAIPHFPDLHTPDEDVTFYLGRIEESPGLVWLDAADHVQGFVLWEGDVIEHLYVDPAHQRAGIGSTLLQAAIRDMQVPEVRLWAFQDNEHAVSFYTKHGFHVVQATDGAGNEEQLPDFLFALVVADSTHG